MDELSEVIKQYDDQIAELRQRLRTVTYGEGKQIKEEIKILKIQRGNFVSQRDEIIMENIANKIKKVTEMQREQDAKKKEELDELLTI
jgi:cystathionine beta-lyase family protein involved in aluminum resistance